MVKQPPLVHLKRSGPSLNHVKQFILDSYCVLGSMYVYDSRDSQNQRQGTVILVKIDACTGFFLH